MITGDNPLTAATIAREAGVDDFLAEATPEDKDGLIQREQAGGKLVAMTGDGTNDAPRAGQADVGVAMNTGTQAAKEAGNMVDLDSNPTKLIEVVEIGKAVPDYSWRADNVFNCERRSEIFRDDLQQCSQHLMAFRGHIRSANSALNIMGLNSGNRRSSRLLSSMH